MESRPLSVLFLCTGNSGRSIMAEALLNGIGAGRFRAYSAGSQPTGVVNRFALELVRDNRLPAEGLRSKSWDGFVRADGPRMDFVFTLCDRIQDCPRWPGQPLLARWGVRDPANIEGDVEARRRAFFHAYTELQNRLRILVNLSLERLDAPALQRELDEIGRPATREARQQAVTSDS